MKVLSEKQKFVFANESTIIINATKENLKLLKQLENIDFYTMLQNNFKKDLLLSNWKKADYMTEDKVYILIMPFIDTERIQKLNMFYKNNQNISRKIYIATLKENIEKLNETLINKTNFIELDNWLGGIDEKDFK